MFRRSSNSPSRPGSPLFPAVFSGSGSSSPDRAHQESTSAQNSPKSSDMPYRQRTTSFADRLCLNPTKVNYRRHSSEIKNILPKISISRAKSEIELNSSHSSTKPNLLINQTIKRVPCNTLATYSPVRSTEQLKEHNYLSVTKVLKSSKCRVCSESIYFQGQECTECKLLAHKKCLANLYVKCPSKVMPPRLAVFGLSISDDDQVSELLDVCIREIENRSITNLKWLYKTESNLKVVANLCLSFEFGPQLVDLTPVNVHDITGVVKEYLTKLSTPIFSQEMEAELVNIGREWPVRKVPYTQSGMCIFVFEIRHLLSYLSASHRNNLAYLIGHFKRIVDRQPLTEMSANALAMVFANILFKESRNDISVDSSCVNMVHSLNEQTMNGSMGKFAQSTMIINVDVTYKIRILELMITHSKDIFS